MAVRSMNNNCIKSVKGFYFYAEVCYAGFYFRAQKQKLSGC